MSDSLRGQRVLITAGASGIGLATVRRFLQAGAEVHFCDIDAEAVEVVRRAHPQASASVTDVADEAQVLAMFEQVAARWGRWTRWSTTPGWPGRPVAWKT
ncbi:short chain dehydrogenase [Bordetella trematum]|nr:short chain dehydrogenase [Bordetella trematum]